MTIDDTNIDVQIDDIALGFEPDGTPKTVPAGTDKAAAATAGGGKAPVQDRRPANAQGRAPTIAELNAARAQADAKAREAADAQATAKAERARADAEARARVQAESQAFTNQDEALRQYHARVSGELSQITSAIASTQTLAASAERELQAALADETAQPVERAARVAKAQREVARAEAELVQLQAGKSGVEHAVTEAKVYLDESTRRAQAAAAGAAATAHQQTTTQATQGQQPQQITPEQWIEGVRQRAGGKVADWLSQHKEFVTDDKLRTKMVAFADHYNLVDEKPINTDEFIAALNARFLPDAGGEGEEGDEGEGESDGDTVEAVTDEPPRRQAKAPAAPVSRAGSYFSSRNPSGSKIKLSPYLAQVAREMGVDPKEYALNALDQIRKGKLPKNFLDPDYQHA